jgi:hypothetical protein
VITDPRDLKNLAETTVTDGEVNPEIARFVIKKLSSRELKSYLFYLKQALRNSRVNVAYAGALDDASRKKIDARFAGKQITYSQAGELGGGVEIEFEDNVMKMNIKNMIERTVERLKGNP